MGETETDNSDLNQETPLNPYREIVESVFLGLGWQDLGIIWRQVFWKKSDDFSKFQIT
jgi:hypothetical protein